MRSVDRLALRRLASRAFATVVLLLLQYFRLRARRGSRRIIFLPRPRVREFNADLHDMCGKEIHTFLRAAISPRIRACIATSDSFAHRLNTFHGVPFSGMNASSLMLAALFLSLPMR